jgi:ABC-type sugar transport system ATPase subunit
MSAAINFKPAPLKNAVAVDLKGVHKWYGDFHVLKDVNLAVAKGERLVICGRRARANPP